MKVSLAYTQTHSKTHRLSFFSDTHSRPVLQGHKTGLIRELWQQVPTQAASWPTSAQGKSQHWSLGGPLRTTPCNN